jgi:hypothetical protein
MSRSEDLIFSAQELVAISVALQNQIEDCLDYLSNPGLTIAEKTKLNQAVQVSRSAASRLDKILKSNNIDPLESPF